MMICKARLQVNGTGTESSKMDRQTKRRSMCTQNHVQMHAPGDLATPNLWILHPRRRLVLKPCGLWQWTSWAPLLPLHVTWVLDAQLLPLLPPPWLQHLHLPHRRPAAVRTPAAQQARTGCGRPAGVKLLHGYRHASVSPAQIHPCRHTSPAYHC